MSTPVELVQRDTVKTTDPGQARSVLDLIYEVGVRFTALPETRWDLSLSTWNAPSFSLASLRLPGVLEFDTLGQRDVVISTTLRGLCSMERGPEASRYGVGASFVGLVPDQEWRAVCEHVSADTVTLSQSFLTDVAGRADEDAVAGWTFSAYQASASGSVAWRQATRYVQDLLAHGERVTPLTISSAGRLLAATALSVFPNTAVAETTVEDRRDALPTALRRAVSFIEGNPDLDITVRDIARAALVTPRTLQIAFRRHLGTTPMVYLRRVRLDRVRADLRDADPGTGATVTRVATRWGFADASRFSATYRAAYGESPRDTLRR